MPLPIRNVTYYTRGVDVGRAREFASGRRKAESTGCLVVWSRRELLPPARYIGFIERIGGLAYLAKERRQERRPERRQMVDSDQVTGALSRAGLKCMTKGA